MQYQSTLHSLSHLRQNLDKTTKVSVSRLEQIENLSENIRVRKQAEGELRGEIERTRGRLVEVEGRCVVSERSLNKIKNGVKSFWIDHHGIVEEKIRVARSKVL